jgi:hypothetical protein
MRKTINILWSDLGCPTAPGLHHCRGHAIHVRQSHIDSAGGHPYSTFALIDVATGPEPRYVLVRVNAGAGIWDRAVELRG